MFCGPKGTSKGARTNPHRCLIFICLRGGGPLTQDTPEEFVAGSIQGSSDGIVRQRPAVPVHWPLLPSGLLVRLELLVRLATNPWAMPGSGEKKSY